MLRSSYLAALDVGSSKVAAAIAEITAAQEFSIVGLGLAETSGVRRGAVVDREAATGSIRRAIAQAELMAGVRVDGAHVGLSGSLVTGFNSRGVVCVAGDGHVVTAADVARAVAAAVGMELPSGREIVHVLPQDFVIDDHEGITAPIGLTGTRLEANVYVATVDELRAQNVIDAVNGAGVAVRDLTLDVLAASEAVVSDEEKVLGVVVIDIGAGATHYAIFERGALVRSGTVPIGGDHFTTAIAVTLCTPPADAEKLKQRCGWAAPASVEDLEEVVVPSLGRRPVRRMPQRMLSEILERQAAQLFHALLEEIRRQGFADPLSAGLVITGGGAILGGITEVAERVFDWPARRGSPAGIGGLVDYIKAPAYATTVGLLRHAYRHPVLAPLTHGGISVGRLFRDLFAAGRLATRAS
jgi:cell division protein FtsA